MLLVATQGNRSRREGESNAQATRSVHMIHMMRKRMLFCLEILVVVYVCISRKAKAAMSHIHLVANGYEKTNKRQALRTPRAQDTPPRRKASWCRNPSTPLPSRAETGSPSPARQERRQDKIKQQAQQGTARHSKAQQGTATTASGAKALAWSRDTFFNGTEPMMQLPVLLQSKLDLRLEVLHGLMPRPTTPFTAASQLLPHLSYIHVC